MLERGQFQLTQKRNPVGEFLVGLFRKEWRGYTSIYDHPELFSRLIEEKPLLVVHPGYLRYIPRED